jgi:hypothetical protein
LNLCSEATTVEPLFCSPTTTNTPSLMRSC